MSEWQPIETAPKDGTEILLAWRMEHFCNWMMEVAVWSDSRERWILAWDGDEIEKPDMRWTPLPEPPR